MRTTVILDFDVEGFHYYPGAPEEVAFLAYEHRHLFRIRMHYEVTHLNRQIEIFIQERVVKKMLSDEFGTPCMFGARSCESIASWLTLQRGDMPTPFKAEVYEDGRGGAIFER